MAIAMYITLDKVTISRQLRKNSKDYVETTQIESWKVRPSRMIELVLCDQGLEGQGSQSKRLSVRRNPYSMNSWGTLNQEDKSDDNTP